MGSRNLRDKERADVVVIAMHMGLEEDLRTGEINPGQVTNENQAIAIAKEVPGVDVIFMGHTHQTRPSLLSNGVLLTQANHWGRHLARADLYLEKEGGSWRVYAQGRAHSSGGRSKSSPIRKFLNSLSLTTDETQKWLSRVIGESAGGTNCQGSALSRHGDSRSDSTRATGSRQGRCFDGGGVQSRKRGSLKAR